MVESKIQSNSSGKALNDYMYEACPLVIPSPDPLGDSPPWSARAIHSWKPEASGILRSQHKIVRQFSAAVIVSATAHSCSSWYQMSLTPQELHAQDEQEPEQPLEQVSQELRGGQNGQLVDGA